MRCAALALFALPVATPVAARGVVVEERSIDALQATMAAGRASSVELTRAYLAARANAVRLAGARHVPEIPHSLPFAPSV